LTQIASAFAFAFASVTGAHAQRGPTPEDYVTNVVGEARIVAAGELVLAGRKVSCRDHPTVLHDLLDDYGAAYPGFIILNLRRLQQVSRAVKLWTYAHECGHQFRGPDEEAADCFAVQRGRREGWLTPAGLEEICRFIAAAPESRVHSAGPKRCEAMRACYADRSAVLGRSRPHNNWPHL
jgi:hypothetical protein